MVNKTINFALLFQKSIKLNPLGNRVHTIDICKTNVTINLKTIN